MGLFDIYSKEDWRVVMAKEEKDIKLKKVLQDMSHSLNHIEDIMADDRALLVKLVTQNNTIVDYLKQLEVEVNDLDYGIEEPPVFGTNLPKDKIEELKQLFDDFKSRKDELKEFEKELKKHKGDLTPGQVGES